MKYLIKETTSFYDGHGEGAKGAVELFISDDDCYKELDSNKLYDDDLKELPRNYENDLYEQDGYHCRHVVVQVREISDEESIHLQHIINQYDKLLITFK